MIIDGQKIQIKTFKTKEKIKYTLTTVAITSLMVTAVFTLSSYLETLEKPSIEQITYIKQNTPYYPNIKEGSIIYASALEAINETNGQEANEWISNCLIDIYDIKTGKRLNLSKEDLYNEDTLNKYNQERYCLIIGKDEIDGYVNIKDILSPQKRIK